MKVSQLFHNRSFKIARSNKTGIKKEPKIQKPHSRTSIPLYKLGVSSNHSTKGETSSSSAQHIVHQDAYELQRTLTPEMSLGIYTFLKKLGEQILHNTEYPRDLAYKGKMGAVVAQVNLNPDGSFHFPIQIRSYQDPYVRLLAIRGLKRSKGGISDNFHLKKIRRLTSLITFHFKVVPDTRTYQDLNKVEVLMNHIHLSKSIVAPKIAFQFVEGSTGAPEARFDLSWGYHAIKKLFSNEPDPLERYRLDPDF